MGLAKNDVACYGDSIGDFTETTSQTAWRVENINLNAAKSGCIEGVAKLNASFPSNKGPENYIELLGMDPYSSLSITS